VAADLDLALHVPGTPYAAGDVWEVLGAAATDGDTVRAHLSGHRPAAVPPVAVLGALVAPCSVVSLDPRVYPRGASIRLVTLDTPEKRDKGPWAAARADCQAWLDSNLRYGIRAETWSLEGNLGRLLGDLYVAADRGQTLSQYMLLRGWLPWQP
jgi:endonuclease YncB( thermonuclease family)